MYFLSLFRHRIEEKTTSLLQLVDGHPPSRHSGHTEVQCRLVMKSSLPLLSPVFYFQMYEFRWPYKTPTAAMTMNYYHSFFPYLRVWIHIKYEATVRDSWSPSHYTECMISDSNTLFKTWLYTYSPFCSQSSSEACTVAGTLPCSQEVSQTEAAGDELPRAVTQPWHCQRLGLCFVAYVAFLKLLVMNYFHLHLIKAAASFHNTSLKAFMYHFLWRCVLCAVKDRMWCERTDVTQSTVS